MSDLKDHRGTEDLSKVYRWDEESTKYVEVLWPDQPEGRGAGEVLSTVHDYAEFLKCMVHQTEPILRTATRNL